MQRLGVGLNAPMDFSNCHPRVCISCENEEQFSHPVLHTGEVTVISSNRAMFHGRIVNSSDMEIIDHGFVGDTEPETGINNILKHSLGPLLEKSFKVKVQSGFAKDIKS